MPAKKSRTVAWMPLLGPGCSRPMPWRRKYREGHGQPHDDMQDGEWQLEQDDAAHGDARHGLEQEQAGIERPDQLPVVAEPEVQEGVECRLQLHSVRRNLDQRRREQRPARHGQEADNGRRDHGHQALVADHGVQRINQAVVHLPALLHGADVLHQYDDQEKLQRLAVAQAIPAAPAGLGQIDPEQGHGEQGDDEHGQRQVDLAAQQQDEQDDQQQKFGGEQHGRRSRDL